MRYFDYKYFDSYCRKTDRDITWTMKCELRPLVFNGVGLAIHSAFCSADIDNHCPYYNCCDECRNQEKHAKAAVREAYAIQLQE